jgi:hypothetical protein
MINEPVKGMWVRRNEANWIFEDQDRLDDGTKVWGKITAMHETMSNWVYVKWTNGQFNSYPLYTLDPVSPMFSDIQVKAPKAVAEYEEV